MADQHRAGRPGRADDQVLVVASLGWKAAALALVAGGWVVAILLARAILLIAAQIEDNGYRHS